MKLKMILKQSIIALKANKLRSFLSILGIVIGVAAVVIILSVGQGLKGLILNEIEVFGTDILQIGPKLPGKDQLGTAVSSVSGVTVTTLKPADAEALRDKINFPYIVDVSAFATGQEWVTYRGNEAKALTFATDNEYLNIDRMAEVGWGRFFSREESKDLTRAVVLGYGVAQDLFGRECSVIGQEEWCGEDPLGKRIKVRDQSLEVIGVMAKRDAILGFDYNDIIFLPLETGLKLIMGKDYLIEIDVRVKDESYFSQAKIDIERLLRYRHNIVDPDKDDFAIVTMKEALAVIDEVTLITNLLLAFLAGISLLVGGVGIMNIMLVSVTERTREIGLRKALGATSKNISAQFLIESVIVTGLGGLVGIFWGVLISVLASVVVATQISSWPIVISIPSIIIAFLVSSSIGLIFGVYPAKKAADLNPIEALRHE